MAFYREESEEDARECPVCYESLAASRRTLSCGHVFCHDCLVKTLVSVNSDGGTGGTGGTIVCPVCRHLTFVRKQKATPASPAADKDPGEAQTLEVPLPLLLRGVPSAGGGHWIARCFRRMSERARRQRLVSPGRDPCQIFIISAHGRPMCEDDALSVVVTVVRPQHRICTTARWLLVLLSAFTVLALVAATLPWVLLA